MNEETKKEIEQIVNETYLDDVKCTICGRKYLKISADSLEVISEVTRGVSIVLAFLVPLWEPLSYVSGSIGTCGMVSRGLSSFTMKESKERTTESNLILEKINAQKIVDIAIDSAEGRNQEI